MSQDKSNRRDSSLSPTENALLSQFSHEVDSDLKKKNMSINVPEPMKKYPSQQVDITPLLPREQEDASSQSTNHFFQNFRQHKPLSTISSDQKEEEKIPNPLPPGY